MNFENGDRCLFTTRDSALVKYNKTTVIIIRPLDENECDIEDVGYMYLVKFFDGTEDAVFEDELQIWY